MDSSETPEGRIRDTTGYNPESGGVVTGYRKGFHLVLIDLSFKILVHSDPLEHKT